MSQTKSRTKAQPEGLRGVLCAWCGQQGAWSHPVLNTVVSPPVDGYPVDEQPMHRTCASQAAMSGAA